MVFYYIESLAPNLKNAKSNLNFLLCLLTFAVIVPNHRTFWKSDVFLNFLKIGAACILSKH